MTPAEALAGLRRVGLRLRCEETANGLRIMVKPTPSVADAELIRQHRAELLALLLDELRTESAKRERHDDNWTPWGRLK